MTQLVKSGCTVFDIGACRGESARKFIDAGAGLIVSVEATLQNYLALYYSQLHGVVPIHAAAWSDPGFVNVAYSIREAAWSSVQPDKWLKAYPDARFMNATSVAAITLDQMCAMWGQPSVVKIDVEGSEKEVLRGMRSFRPDVLIYEFHHQYPEDAEECLDIASAMGFTLAAPVSEELDLQTVPSMTLSEFHDYWKAGEFKWGNITLS